MTDLKQTRRGAGALVNQRRLRLERTRLSMTQVQFAELCELSPRRIGELETELGARIQPGTLKRVSGVLGVDPTALILESGPPHLITRLDELLETSFEIVRSARDFLYVTGSRTRDDALLAAMVQAIEADPDLVHRRILFGPPRTKQMVEHLHALLAFGDPRDRYARRMQAIGIACSDGRHYPAEVTICMNESRALIELPSIVAPWICDTAVLFDHASVISGWHNWIEAIFALGPRINDPSQIGSLVED